MNTFEIGSWVQLTVRDLSAYARENPWMASTEIAGKVIENPKWLGSDYVSVLTGNARHPVSYVPVYRIMSANGKLSPTAQIVDDQTWEVAGSKGNTYTVTQSKSGFTCSCKGFEFRKHCRHITEIQNKIANKL
jgi:hypothetical protein